MNSGNHKSKFVKIHHAVVSNYLILETKHKHVIIPQNIHYKKKIYKICLFFVYSCRALACEFY